MNDASIEFNKQLELDVLLNGLTTITEEYVCKFNWRMLDEVVIPSGIIDIGYEAFGGCSNLRNVTIGNNVTHIGRWAFRACRHLTNVIIPASVTYISDGVFKMSGDPGHLPSLTFKNRTISEVRFMAGYPWGIPPENISVRVW